ncbi:hypothetical protein [Neisseria sp. HMSC077D05]|uniref:hypothetical protein n=1 Tax=Neisseria sp. HMSC077D05 TaxID=1715079 RepID=UPI0009F553EA|nr:hypothetical protein [Neisseria sp. HMSC077D05]
MDIAKTSIRATLTVPLYPQGRTWNVDGNSVRKERQRSSENPKSDFQTTFVPRTDKISIVD